MKKLLIFIALAIVIYFLVTRLLPKTGIEERKAAPDFETTGIDGSLFRMSDMQGNYILLDFWGSWCGPCIAEAPSMVQLYNEFADVKFPGGYKFEIVSIALEKTDRHWKKVADKFGYIWPHQIVEVGKFVRMNDIATAYGVTDIPAKFLIDPEGNFIAVHPSIEEVRSILQDKLNE